MASGVLGLSQLASVVAGAAFEHKEEEQELPPSRRSAGACKARCDTFSCREERSATSAFNSLRDCSGLVDDRGSGSL